MYLQWDYLSVKYFKAFTYIFYHFNNLFNFLFLQNTA